jgi:hypothetical protein
VPTFDADSIWNFFLAEPMNDLGVRASWDATRHWAFAAGARARAFSVQTANENVGTIPGSSATSPNGLAAANYFPSSSLDVMGGGNLSARWHFGEGILSARAGVWQWDDKLRTDRDAVSFQYVLGAGYNLWSRSRVFADFEHDMNRISGQRFRGMLWLSLAVSK